MKIRKIPAQRWLPLTVAVLSMLSGSVHAGGVRGGGIVIDVNSTPYLADLVTHAKCTFKSGADLMAENSELANVVGMVTKLDWYFGLEIKRELTYLSYCFTGPLYRMPDHGLANGVIAEELEQNVRQGAYRLNDKAYVDQKIWNSMNPHNQAFLVLHEMLHSYLPMDLLDRKIMLRSLVFAFERVEKGEINTRAGLNAQMKASGVSFPLSTNRIDRFQKVITFLTSSLDEQIESIRAESNPETLTSNRIEAFKPYLAEWDSMKLNSNEFRTALRQALVESTPEQFKALLEKKYQSIDIIELVSSLITDLSDENRDQYFASPTFGLEIQKNYSSLSDLGISTGEYRLLANSSLVSLSEEGRLHPANREALYLTDLHGPEQVPPRLTWMVNTIVALVQNKRMDLVAYYFTKNPSFYQLLGLKDVKKALDLMAAPTPREKPVAVGVLQNLQEQLVATVIKAVTQQLSREDAEIFENTINKSDFNHK